MNDNIKRVYGEYKHMDTCISDPQWGSDSLPYRIVRDLWMAIKADIGDEE